MYFHIRHGRVDGTHGGVLNLHREVFSEPHHTHTTTHTTTHITRRLARVLTLVFPCVFLCLTLASDMYGVASDGRGALSAAKRRRERRLRCHWKHECLSVRMAVAAARHHSSGREGVEGETYDAPRRQKPPPTGSLPAPLSEVAGRQEVLVRHVVEHMADVCPVVQTLDAPVPQMVDTVLEFFRALDPPVDEQVITVPKISTDRVSQRLVERCLPQMVEQLVEVPTVLTPTRIPLQIAEQLVNVPVPQVSVPGRGHQGSLSGQGSVGEQIVDIPVPRGRGKRRVQGFLPEQSTTAQSVEQTVDIPASRRRGRRGGLQGLPQGQGSTASFQKTIAVDRPQGFPRGQSSTASAVEQSIGVACGGLHVYLRFLPGDEDDPPERFGTVLEASGDMGPGVIRADGGKLFRFQLPSWFIIPVGARVAFRAEEGLEVNAAYDVYCWDE